jgi:hypothetical protein
VIVVIAAGALQAEPLRQCRDFNGSDALVEPPPDYVGICDRRHQISRPHLDSATDNPETRELIAAPSDEAD